MTSIGNIGPPNLPVLAGDDSRRSKKNIQRNTQTNTQSRSSLRVVSTDPSLEELRSNYKQLVIQNEYVRAAQARLNQSSLGAYMSGKSATPPRWIRDGYSIIAFASPELNNAFSDEQNQRVQFYQKQGSPMIVVRSQDPEGNITYGVIINDLRDQRGNLVNLTHDEMVQVACNQALSTRISSIEAHEDMHRFTLELANQDPDLPIKPPIPKEVSQEVVVTIKGTISNKDDFLNQKEQGTLDMLTFGHTDSTRDSDIEEKLNAYNLKIRRAKKNGDVRTLTEIILPELQRILKMLRIWVMAAIAPLALENTKFTTESQPSDEDWARCAEAIGYRDQIIRLIQMAKSAIKSLGSSDGRRKVA
jgi:hypothetical protein